MSKLKVYYGFTKLTPKIMKNREVAIFYSNGNWWNSEAWVKQRIEVIYERFQTDAEATDAEYKNRIFSKAGYLVDKRPYNGDLNKVLQANFDAEKGIIPDIELEKIRKVLNDNYYKYYRISRPKKVTKKEVKQLELI